MSSSRALVFLLSTILAVHSAATGGGGTEKLMTPSLRQRAETSFAFLAKEGPVLVDACYKNNHTLMRCFGALHGHMQTYIANLCGLKPERSDVEFGEAKARLEDLLSEPLGSVVRCSFDHLLKEKPLVGEVYEYEVMLQGTLELMKAAVQTQPAPGPGRAQAPRA